MATIATDDWFSPAKANLAVLLSSQGRNDEAATLLREFLRDYPENIDARHSLALLLAETGHVEEGLDVLARVAKARPNDARTHYNFGLLLQQVGRIDEAVRDASCSTDSRIWKLPHRAHGDPGCLCSADRRRSADFISFCIH